MYSRKTKNETISAIIRVTVIATIAAIAAISAVSYIIMKKYKKFKSVSFEMDCSTEPDDNAFCEIENTTVETEIIKDDEEGE